MYMAIEQSLLVTTLFLLQGLDTRHIAFASLEDQILLNW